MSNYKAEQRERIASLALAGLLANPQLAKDMVKSKMETPFVHAWMTCTALMFADSLIKGLEDNNV